jgi:hypothetical protein
MLKRCWPDSPKQPRGFTMNKTNAEEPLDLNFGKQFRSPPGACTDLWPRLQVFEPASPPFYTGLANDNRCALALDAQRDQGGNTDMTNLTGRAVLRGSVGLAAGSALVHPYISNAAATTAEVWWNQGFVPEEDAAFRAMVAEYEKASGNKIDQSLVPFAPMRQKRCRRSSQSATATAPAGSSS